MVQVQYCNRYLRNKLGTVSFSELVKVYKTKQYYFLFVLTRAYFLGSNDLKDGSTVAKLQWFKLS